MTVTNSHDALVPSAEAGGSPARSWVPAWLREAARPGGIAGILLSLGMVAVVTVLLMAVRELMGELPPIAITFLIPVSFAAIRWGFLAAIVTAVAGALTSAFFFYRPMYSFAVQDPARVISLALFVIVAVTTSHLAARNRRESELARKREIEIRDLYAFSCQLTSASSTSDIFDAIQQHLSSLVRRQVALFGPSSTSNSAEERFGEADVPPAVHDAASALLSGRLKSASGVIRDCGRGNLWLVKSVSPKTTEFGVIAIDLGRGAEQADAEFRGHIEALLEEAATTLERLGLSHALTDARMRSEAERFRDALIGSVSHELRTPLASILGAATVLSGAPAVQAEPRLAALATVVREEADRLNSEIQNLLDATRISGEGLQPRFEWTEPADFINAAIEHCRDRLAGHRIELHLPDELLLLHIDLVLVEQTLRQVLDNAAKYSAPGSAIVIRGIAEDGYFVLSVQDEGTGLSAEERDRIGQRFYRGSRHAQTISGSGLGFWIARSFMAANGGRLEAESAGENKGTTVRLYLPLPGRADAKEEAADE